MTPAPRPLAIVRNVPLLVRPRLAPSLALCAAGIVLPSVALLAVGERTVYLSSSLHFGAVGGSALAATAASLALTIVGVHRRDGRTVVVGTAFSAVAALLSLHGLASPGVLVDKNGFIAFSGGTTLPIGGLLLALLALPGFRDARRIRLLVGLQVVLFGAIAIVGTAGMLVPSIVRGVPEPRSAAAVLLLAAGLAVYAFMAVRALGTVLLTRRLCDALVVVGLACLAAALIGSLLLDYTQLGWWLGHLFEVLGLSLVGAAVAVDLHRARQSRPLTGGMGAWTHS